MKHGKRIIGQPSHHTRTVRSVAPSRNLQSPQVGLIVVALVALGLVLLGFVTSASAAPSRAPHEDAMVEDRDDDMTAPPDWHAADRGSDPDVTERIALPLPVRDVVAAAYRAAGIADNPVSGWSIRSRLVGLVPWLSTRVGRDQSWRGVDDPTLGYREVWDVRATWHIDRLLFDPNEMRIAAVDINRRRERRRVAAEATHAYYRWLIADSAARRASRDGPRWAVRRDELLAELDVLTDGWILSALAGRNIPH